MNIWRWLITTDPNPGYTTNKVLKLAVRVLLFAVFAALVSSLLQLTPLGPYVKTTWGSMILVFALYLPLMKFMGVDTFVPRSRPAPPSTQAKAGQPSMTAAERRREKNRFAGVKKAPPKYGGRR